MGILISIFPNPWILRSGSCYFYSIAKALNSTCLSSSYNFLYSSSAFVPLEFIFILQLEDLFSHLYSGFILMSWLSLAIRYHLAFLEARFHWTQGTSDQLPSSHHTSSVTVKKNQHFDLRPLVHVLPLEQIFLFLCLSNFMPFKTQVLLDF